MIHNFLIIDSVRCVRYQMEGVEFIEFVARQYLLVDQWTFTIKKPKNKNIYTTLPFA